ncbi:acetate--CoA ligase family protein [Halarchaeum sp. CBA1220]|uniref:acetate--CoA ligase family protein n=1 Tax=Halarchaeum sp. CBA1220 TaxID=1853682 RepID=UPI000F3AA153|nr:acetate--CoA ligase [Halarchaeum sp. CBA1220]QLC34542.1 acetate--CoA ligase family protein [Halarchaeum sp. CBA1220]
MQADTNADTDAEADADADGLFVPERVAVVGATDREGSVGRAILTNLAEFDGDVVAVNPGRERVLDYPCYDDLAGVPGPVDLAVVVVPPGAVADVVRDAGEAGVPNVVVVTAGFGEAGSEGANRERELVALAEEYGITLVGPNCLGVMSTRSGLNASFGPQMALPGSVAFMSQSGAFITAVLDWARDQGFGFSDVVSLGNKAVEDETDFMRRWAQSEETNVVLAYLESIVDGRAFIDTAREVTTDTPVVAVKSGRTSAGAQAASSHTGAIAGSEAAYEAGLEQAGVLRAENVEEFFDFARALDGLPLPDSESVAVVTNAGGPGVMATDAVGDSDLEMASFADATRSALADALPANANVHNPVDVIGDADVARFCDALDTTLADPGVGAVVVVAAPTAVLDYDGLAEAVVDVQREHGKPVVASLMGGERVDAPADVLADAGVPNYFDPARAVGSLDALASYAAISERDYAPPREFADVDRERAQTVLERVTERDSNQLGVEAMELLDAYGIPTPAGGVADSPDEADSLAADLGGDVVMKVVSPDITHKSDIGGVEVGVPRAEVRDTYETLVTRARNYQPDARVLGVQVQERVDTDAGVETIVGMTRDPQFGPLLMFGLGGIFVEVLEDTTFRVAPVSTEEAAAMLDDVDAAPLLRGARGRDPVDREALRECVERLGRLVDDFPAILELDVNPLLARPASDDGDAGGALALDLRLTVDPEKL